jgi:hypothetical protein
MNHPNTFLIQRKALARFRKIIPFLALIPPAIYHTLSPAEWYEPFGEIEQVRAELEEALNCYIMKEHSVILTLFADAVDGVQIPGQRCRYTSHSEAPTSDCY